MVFFLLISSGSESGCVKVSPPSAMLEEDLSGRAITAVTFPALPDNAIVEFFKVMPRAVVC